MVNPIIQGEPPEKHPSALTVVLTIAALVAAASILVFALFNYVSPSVEASNGGCTIHYDVGILAPSEADAWDRYMAAAMTRESIWMWAPVASAAICERRKRTQGSEVER